MQITGIIYRIFDTQQVSDKLKKREFVVEYSDNPSYPQYIKFEVIQEKCDDLSQFKIGDMVEVSFNLKGRKWINPQNQEVFFNTLNAWRIVKVNSLSTTPSTSSSNTTPPYSEPLEPITHHEQENDDLPF